MTIEILNTGKTSLPLSPYDKPLIMKKTNHNKCLIIIINWQQCQLTKKLLETSCFNPDIFDIFIFDNESNNISQSFFDNNKHLFSYYRNSPENLGFDTPCNIGLNFAYERGYNFILFLNNDAIITTDEAEKLLKIVQQNKNIALASPLIKDMETKMISFSGANFNNDKTIIEHIKPFEITDKLNSHQFLLYGTALLGRVLPLKKAGGFYEPFFAYWEDFLLCDRLITLGYACSIIKETSVFHKNDRSDETNTHRSQYYYYYLTRNEVIFWKKVAPSSIKPIYWLVRQSISTCIDLIKQSNYSQAKAIIIGLLDGFLGKSGRWKYHIKKIK